MAKEVLLKTKAQLEAALPMPPHEIDLNFKFMFGGMGAFARGRMFAALLGEDVAFKLPPDQVEDAVREGGVHWVYDDKGKSMTMNTYMIMPHDIIADPEKCGYWMQLAIEFAIVQPAKLSRPRKKAK
ncbi:MAG: TfoX/Sxy family protein [Anaerolineae bacterium]|nr:TfoX/Sxy family protein [Anaerolineae bacterium]NUQ03362.1 TfoX/Sxy family protein [Anaerolineae bacterium]